MKLKTFENADYWLDDNGRQITNSDLGKGELELLINMEGPKALQNFTAVHSQLLIGDGVGIYIPAKFYKDFNLEGWHIKPEDFKELENVDSLEYWQAWDDLLNDAYYLDENGLWRLEQDDGSLFARLYIDNVTYKVTAKFKGRKKDAIGIFYPIIHEFKTNCDNREWLEYNLYNEFSHISELTFEVKRIGNASKLHSN